MRQLIKTKVALLRRLKADVYLLGFRSPYISRNIQPGQFLHIKVDNTILRRPFSIHKISNGMIYILFRVRGRGTKILSQYKKSDTLDIIGPLGKGFSYNGRWMRHDVRILVAGGMGVAPLLFLAERLAATGNPQQATRNTILLGAKNKNEILAEQEFRRLGFDVRVATEDGSRGFKGTVTVLLKNLLTTHHTSTSLSVLHRSVLSLSKDSPLTTQIYACGPKEMFSEIGKVLKEYPQIDCEVSFEQFMGCGLGVCYGCVIETKDGYRKVCKDGPVFKVREIW